MDNYRSKLLKWIEINLYLLVATYWLLALLKLIV